MGEGIYQALQDALAAQRPAVLHTRLDTRAGEVSLHLHRWVGEDLHPDGKGVVFPFLREQAGALELAEPVLPPERLLLFGAGHVARPVCRLAAACGFRVTVVDDRREFVTAERFPAAAELLCMDFLQAVERLKPGPYDYAVIVTRGHAHDAACLRGLLSGRFPAYLGMIGSRKRVQAQLELLEGEGFSRTLLDAVCTPIGLPIGSVTPAEIAVSILAQVISYRRLPQYARPGRWVNGSDLEPELVTHLAHPSGPMAVATLLRTTGSAPRKAGAKLLLRPDGSLLGSIGGGRVEAEAIRRGLALMGTGRFEVFTMDLNGDVARDEGMACGGTMEVLVEDLP